MPGGYENKWAQVSERGEPQPRYDSYGRKVPEWDTRELKDGAEHKRGGKQSTWSAWLWKGSALTTTSTATCSSSGGSETDDGKPSWWTPWTSRTGPGRDPRLNSKDEQPLSPYNQVSSRVFGDANHDWKPITVKLPVLGSIFVVTVALIVAIEVLTQRSVKNGNGGGLVFGETVDDISSSAKFSYLYLPTLLAVVYSMAWSWVDIDAKRLEPWFQLSKPEGADAMNSLLLEYPFGFLPLVPIKAARKRHWAVAMAGATMVFVAWAIVPLQAAIFALGEVTRTMPTQMTTMGVFTSKEAQATGLNSNFLMTAFGVAWLDRRPPPFTTKGYALMPFAPLEEKREKVLFAGETWTTTTQMFYANLTCAPPVRMNVSANFFDSGDGCILGRDPDVPIELARRQEVTRTGSFLGYLQYFDDPNISDSFYQRATQFTVDGSSTTTCDRSHWNKFLAHAWNETHETVLFCQPSYHGRTVNATVAASDNTVVAIDYDYTSPPDIAIEDVFDLVRLHLVMGTGSPNMLGVEDDKPNTETIESFARISGLASKYDAMVPFGLASSPYNLSDFSDPVILHDAFERAHTLLFAMAINQAISDAEKSTDKRAGFLQDSPRAIKLDRTFSIVVEACLAAVASLTVALWVYFRKRRSNMVSDPAAISDIMMLIRTSHTLLHDFQDNGRVTEKILAERLKGQRFRLVASSRGGLSEMKLETSLSDTSPQLVDPSQRSRTHVDGFEKYKAIRPWQMKLFAGIGIGLIVAASIGVGVFLYHKTLKDDGLERPTNNSFILLLITQIAPTAYAQLNEPLWLLLNRLLCVFQPFEDLRHGNAPSATTLNAKYTAVPPPLALWRALRAKHLVLALICAVSISTNALAIALGALFEESPTSVSIPVMTKSKLLDGNYTLNRTGLEGGRGLYNDPWYVALANVSASGSAPLPAWQDNQYYYLPFDLPNLAEHNITARSLHLDGYESSTTGYGIKVTCIENTPDDPIDSVQFSEVSHSSGQVTMYNITTTHRLENGTDVTCAFPGGYPGSNATEVAHSLEVMAHLSTRLENATSNPLVNVYNNPDPWCGTHMLAGWARLEEVAPGAHTNTSLRAKTSRFMTCGPKFQTAKFNIRTDSEGRILSTNRTSSFDHGSEFASNQTITDLMVYIVHLATSGDYATDWHNGTFTGDWMNSLIKANWGNASLVDPATPVPDIPTIIPVIEDMFQRLFPTLMKQTIETYMKDLPSIDHLVIAITTETRIFMDPLMFYLSISLLSLQLVAIFFYYANRPRRFLPRMPLSVASIIAYVSASYAVHDIVGTTDDRYGYGRFIGTDGQPHVGIEKQSRLVPLESRNPEAPRRRWPWSGKKDSAQPRIWI